MEFFKINNKTIASPTEISNSFESLDKQERTMDGTMVVDEIGKKNKVDVKWEYLSKEDMKTLTNELWSSTFVTVSFRDKDSGDLVTMHAVGKDLSYSPHYNWVRSCLMWKSVSVSFVER